MNKLISRTLLILSSFVGIILLVSLVLISERSLKFILNINQSTNVDFVLTDRQWHPYKPSIEIDVLSVVRIKEQSSLMETQELKVNFNLLSIFQGRLIESLYAKDMDFIIHPSSKEDQINLNSLWFYVASIKNLRIEEFSLKDLKTNSSILNGELSAMAFQSGGSKLKFYAKNETGGYLDLRVSSISGSNSFKDYRGFMQTSAFDLNQLVSNDLCSFCVSGILDSKIWFTLIDLELVKLLGDIKFKLNSSLDFINSINAKIKLEDPEKNIFRISSFLNENTKIGAPEVFASISSKEVFVFIPEIELASNQFLYNFKHTVDFPSDLLLGGYLHNIVLSIKDSFSLKVDFEDLSLKSSLGSVSGIAGNLTYTPRSSRLNINTPYLEVELGSLLDSPLVFNNLNSEFLLSLIDEKVFISKSYFKGSYKKNLLQGQVTLFPNPLDSTGDLSLKISSTDLDYLDALDLFPNLNQTKFTKDWLKDSISCGAFQEVFLIYRGPIDNRYTESSASFQSRGLFKDACLELIDTTINEIDLFTKINNTSFLGEVIDGNLYGSEVKGLLKVFKPSNNNYQLELEGSSYGPFLTLLNLANLDSVFEVKQGKSGEHNTNFKFTSPLASNFDLLGKDSDLKISTKIKDGNFHNKQTNLSFSKLYSQIDYDSSDGVRDGFATIKINDIPLKFDIRKVKENGNFNTQFVTEDVVSSRKILSPYGIGDTVKGSSKFNLKLVLPSFVKGQPILDPKIEIASNLNGILVNLPEPFVKSKNSSIDFNLIFKPFLNKSPQLVFKYGDLLRGKFNFQTDFIEGYVIAGKKKQNISIPNGQILLVGELQSLDLGSFISLGIVEGEGAGAGNIFIKDLLVEETNFSNFSLLKTRFKSQRTEDGIEYKFTNKDLSGIFLVPKEKDRNVSFNFDYIRINQLAGSSKDSFLGLYNGIDSEFDFSTKAILINGQDYGNWKFSVVPDDNQLMLYGIEGTYGRWQITNNMNGISSLKIKKKTFGWRSSLEANIYSGSPEKAMKQIDIEPNFELDTLSLDVDLSWDNLPWIFDYNIVSGDISTNFTGFTIRNSEELETPNNLLRLVNIFNITDSFEKITNLDFRKLYKRGFSADSVKGKFGITEKSLKIKEPIILKSGSSEFSWTGEISRDKKGNLDKLNLEVVMTLPLREYLPAYAFVLGGPLTAGIVYIAGKAFERNLDKLSSGKWKVNGKISEPKTEFDGWFEDKKNQ